MEIDIYFNLLKPEILKKIITILSLFLTVCLFSQTKHPDDVNQVLEVPIAFHYIEYDSVPISKENFKLRAERYLDLVNANFSQIDTSNIYKDFKPHLAPDIQIRFVPADVPDQFSMHVFHDLALYSGVALITDINLVLNNITKTDGAYMDIWLAPMQPQAGNGFVSGVGGKTIVINNTHFSTSLEGSEIEFELAFAMTHEIGHFLKLYHPNGKRKDKTDNENCETDDEIYDTPRQDFLNPYGTTLDNAKNSCDLKISDKTNWQNFMDYAYARGMFTKGQRLVMRSFLLDNLSFVSKIHPSNDACINAEFIAPLKADSDIVSRTKGSMFGATSEDVQSASCDVSTNQESNNVWYKFIPKQSDYTVELIHDTALDPVINVYSGTDCDSLIYQTCGKSNTGLETTNISLNDLIEGETYWVRIDHRGNNDLSIEESYFTIGVLINDKPKKILELNDDTFMTAENAVLTFRPFDNDVIPKNSMYSFTNPVYGLVSTYDNNTTSIDDDIWQYTPDVGFSGIDFFTYEICDSNGCQSAMVYIFITPVDDSPDPPGAGFRTQASKKKDFININNFSVSSNPLKQSSRFHINLQESEDINISLIDIQGREVRNVFTGNIKKGVHSFSILGGITVPNGMYVLRVSHNGKITTIKLIK